MSYADNLASARRILAAKGQSVTLTVHSAGAYDPASGKATITDSIVTTTGVVLPLSRGLAHMPGTSIEAGDRQLLIPGDIAQPTIGSIVTIGGTDYTIVEVSPLSPGGTVILHDCIIRGAP